MSVLIFAVVAGLSAFAAAYTPLTPAREVAVRAAIYDGEGGTTLRMWSGLPLGPPLLVVPNEVADAYKVAPRATVALLCRIVEGGRPRDSALAAGYALAVLRGVGEDGLGDGSICVEFFDAAKYDRVQDGWESTYRRHWLTVIEREKAKRR